MDKIVTHNVIFVGNSKNQSERCSFSCNLKIDEVDGKNTAVMFRSTHEGPLRFGKDFAKDKFSSLDKLERFEMVVLASIWSKTTICDVYVVEFIDYKKVVRKNGFDDLGLGPIVDESLEVKLSGGWTIDVGNRDKFAGIIVGYGELFPSEKDLASIRREIKLGGLLG